MPSAPFLIAEIKWKKKKLNKTKLMIEMQIRAYFELKFRAFCFIFVVHPFVRSLPSDRRVIFSWSFFGAFAALSRCFLSSCVCVFPSTSFGWSGLVLVSPARIMDIVRIHRAREPERKKMCFLFTGTSWVEKKRVVAQQAKYDAHTEPSSHSARRSAMIFENVFERLSSNIEIRHGPRTD